MKNNKDTELQEQHVKLDAIYGMLEKVVEGQGKAPKQGSLSEIDKVEKCLKQSETASLNLIGEISQLREETRKAREQTAGLLEGVKKELRKENKIAVGKIIAGNGFAVLVVFMGLFIASLFFNYRQWQSIQVLEDDSLKYRYMKMVYRGENKTINFLDSVFLFDREKLAGYKERVEGYEYRLLQAAERNNRIEENLKENERLLQEIERLKEKK